MDFLSKEICLCNRARQSRQVVELHVRVALLNRSGQIGRAQTVPVAAVA